MLVKWFFAFTLVGVYYTVKKSRAEDIKIWDTNMNFDNPHNWKDGRLPCENDRVIFPASSSVVVFMPESVAVSDMILPLNGELIFPSSATLNITGRTGTGTCVGQDALFQPSVESWYNPTNWNFTSDRLFPPTFPDRQSRRNRAVPHVYRVPCRWDRVQFPSRASFSVQGISPDAIVASLKINGRNYNQDDLSNLLSSSTGKLLFPGNPSIEITNSPCTDPKGCICGNEKEPIFSAICKFEPPTPGPGLCLEPIRVIGHCDPMCATKLEATINPQFRMERYLELHRNLYSHSMYKEVDIFTSRISENKIQTIFVDTTTTNEVANKLAQLMLSIYLADIKSVQSYGLRSIEISMASKFTGGPTSDQQFSTSGMSSGGIVGLVFAILILAVLGAALYIYRRRQIEGFSFARFDLRSDKIELELGTTPHDELEPEEAPPAKSKKDESKGFDNPVFGKKLTPKGSSDAEDYPEVRDFVENPMFQLLEDSSES
ncbi:protein amnionless [Caerostris darwini]|uniref:Protein amnionless n=1 Tax=Caerostris darwini TaxID=1538125 RepID=A0AAV4ULF7_9ARAC|nr:protein amnionless [Caerostris darwini]